MSFKIKKSKVKEQVQKVQTFSWKLNQDSNMKEFKYKLEVGDDVFYARNVKEMEKISSEPQILWHSTT